MRLAYACSLVYVQKNVYASLSIHLHELACTPPPTSACILYFDIHTVFVSLGLLPFDILGTLCAYKLILCNALSHHMYRSLVIVIPARRLQEIHLPAVHSRWRPRHQPRHRRHRDPVRLGLEPASGPAGERGLRFMMFSISLLSLPTHSSYFNLRVLVANFNLLILVFFTYPPLTPIRRAAIITDFVPCRPRTARTASGRRSPWSCIASSRAAA